MRELETELKDEGRNLFMYALCFTRGDAHEARDLVAEAARRAAKSWSKWDRGRSLHVWLRVILKNCALDRRMSYAARFGQSLQRPIKAGSDGGEPIRLGDVLTDNQEGPEAAAERGDTAQRVREAVGRLSEAYGLAIEAVDLQGMSYGEAAEALGLPVGTVRSRVSRGRGVLRALLDPALA